MKVHGRAKKIVLAAILGALLLPEAWAQNVRSRYMGSARCLAAGDSCLGWIDTGEAAFYNPAGLSRPRTFNLQLINIQGAANRDLYRFAQGNLSRDRAKKARSDLDQVRNNQDRNLYADLSMFPYIQIPKLMVGAYGGISYGLDVESATPPSTTIPVRIRAIQDAGAIGGAAIKLFHGIVKLGYSAYWLDRSENIKSLEFSADSDLGDGLKAGQGLAHTGGITLTAPVMYLPMLTAVARDINGTKFNKNASVWSSNPAAAPSERRMTYDFELAWAPRLGQMAVTKVAVGYRDLQNRYREAAGSHWHAGTELEILVRFFFRAGVMHGYGTGGLGVYLPGIKLDVATFGREVGTKFRGKEDRVFMVNLKVGL